MSINRHHQNKVRIIAGTHRSRWVKFPSTEHLRPTAAMVREQVFNWLGQSLTGLKVLDLFSGSGIFAFEAVSRGCSQAVAIESNPTAYQMLLKNQQELQLSAVKPLQRDAMAFLKSNHELFDIIFVDPPYAWQHWEELLQLLPALLSAQGFIYFESNNPLNFSAPYNVLRQGKNGMSHYYLSTLNNTQSIQSTSQSNEN